ncbi:MAG: hypothetical protein ACR2JM_13440, partial [Mycobacterium sp.]
MTGLLTDPTVLTALQSTVAAAVTAQVGDPAAGDLVGTTLVGFVSNPIVVNALTAVVGSLASDFFGSTGVVAAFADAADGFALNVLVGVPFGEAQAEAEQMLRANTAVQDGVAGTVTDAATPFLADTALWNLFGSTTTTTVTDLLGMTSVQNYVGAQVGDMVKSSLQSNPATAAIAMPVGEAIGVAVTQFLATPGAAAGVGAILGSVLPDFLGQFGVPAELGAVAGQFAASLVAGDTTADALAQALAALKASPAVISGLKVTIADVLNLVDTTLLSVPAIQQELGTITTELIIELTADSAVRTYITDALSPVVGPAVAALLTDTTQVAALAATLGGAVTDFLAYPGFSTALTNAIDVYANALLDGETQQAAQQAAVASLTSTQAYDGAVSSVVPPVINSLLGLYGVRDVIGAFAKQQTLDALHQAGINSPFVDAVAGQIVDGTVQWLLRYPSAKDLVDNIVVGVLLGTLKSADVVGYATQAVLHDPFLQLALGFSVGQGIGSLFGNGGLGYFIGLAAG